MVVGGTGRLGDSGTWGVKVAGRKLTIDHWQLTIDNFLKIYSNDGDWWKINRSVSNGMLNL